MTRKQELEQEAAAWRKLAEWCAKHGDFLCNITDAWANDSDLYGPPPFAAPWDAMHTRVSAHADMGFLDPDTGRWREDRQCLGWPREAHDTRVIFCLLMALECEAETKEVPLREH